jgi:hypothetical protein
MTSTLTATINADARPASPATAAEAAGPHRALDAPPRPSARRRAVHDVATHDPEPPVDHSAVPFGAATLDDQNSYPIRAAGTGTG